MERLMIVFRILETKNKMKHKFSSLLLGFMCFSGTIELYSELNGAVEQN